MKIRSAKFIKGVVEADDILEDKKPHIAFIGRSNVGKSSIINVLTGQKDLARTSSFPGRTQEINVFLINKAFYLIDLPGYGFARVSAGGQDRIRRLMTWYLFESPYRQEKIVLIIDANVGLTDNDLEMLHILREYQKNIVLVANKIDKIKSSVREKQLQKIKNMTGNHPMILFSAQKKIGINELMAEIF